MGPEEHNGIENPAEDRIQITQDIIQELLGSLGDAWAEIEQLKQKLETASRAAPRPAASPAPAPAPTSGGPVFDKPAPLGEQPLRRGVLIIDDSKVLQMRLRSFIEPLGYPVLAVADGGVYGADMAISLRPTLVIVDHQMPDMNGLDCVKAIREQNKESRIIVCSAYITAELSRDYAVLGVSEILAKPIQLDLFVKAIHRGMGNAVPERN